ncbi:MAG TPA: hypothetical protein VIL48_09360 [Acidimicrobiales bacterium]
MPPTSHQTARRDVPHAQLVVVAHGHDVRGSGHEGAPVVCPPGVERGSVVAAHLDDVDALRRADRQLLAVGARLQVDGVVSRQPPLPVRGVDVDEHHLAVDVVGCQQMTGRRPAEDVEVASAIAPADIELGDLLARAGIAHPDRAPVDG